MSVFRGLIKKGELGGFGLENMGNIGDLNGTIKLPQNFTPTELNNSVNKQGDITEEEMQQIKQLQIQELRQKIQQGRQQQQQQQQEQEPKFFGEIQEEKVDNFFGSDITQKSQKRVKGGITKEINLFGGNIKVPRNKPLIGNLREGVGAFDSSFNKLNKAGKKPLKRGTGFDNFVGDIDIKALSLGKPDSAVPKTGIFSKKGRRRSNQFDPVDLSQQKVRVLPNPVGFEKVSGSVLPRGLEQFPDEDLSFDKQPRKKAGRPVGSVGKKKRQARKLDKSSKKKKKKSELSKARKSLLSEQERLRKGGTPRNSRQGSLFKSQGVSPNTQDGSFRSFFT